MTRRLARTTPEAGRESPLNLVYEQRDHPILIDEDAQVDPAEDLKGAVRSIKGNEPLKEVGDKVVELFPRRLLVFRPVVPVERVSVVELLSLPDELSRRIESAVGSVRGFVELSLQI